MQQIFLANLKGGCGKTMMSIQLASYYARQNKTVALCDHDEQQSSMDWLRCRKDQYPNIHGIEFYKHKIVTNRFDVAIHDMPVSGDVSELASAIQGHQLLIPVLPSPTDIKAAVRFLMALNRSDVVRSNPNKIGLVANRVNVRTSYFKVLVSFLHQVNLPIIGYLRETQNYVRCISQGAGVFDMPTKQFSTDLEQWQPIIDWLDASYGNDVVAEDQSTRTRQKSSAV